MGTASASNLVVTRHSYPKLELPSKSNVALLPSFNFICALPLQLYVVMIGSMTARRVRYFEIISITVAEHVKAKAIST